MNFKADRYSRVAIVVERIVLMKSLPTVVVVRFILYIYFFPVFSFRRILNEQINF